MANSIVAGSPDAHSWRDERYLGSPTAHMWRGAVHQESPEVSSWRAGRPFTPPSVHKWRAVARPNHQMFTSGDPRAAPACAATLADAFALALERTGQTVIESRPGN